MRCTRGVAVGELEHGWPFTRRFVVHASIAQVDPARGRVIDPLKLY